MFSCIHGSEVVSGDSTSAGGNDTIDRILAEAAKLKLKCKSLRTLLLETETKRNEEKHDYEKEIADLKHQLDTTISELKTQQYVEV